MEGRVCGGGGGGVGGGGDANVIIGWEPVERKV